MRGASATIPWGWCQAGHFIIRVTGSHTETHKIRCSIQILEKVYKIGTLLYIKDSAEFVLCHVSFHNDTRHVYVYLHNERDGGFLMLPLVCASILTVVLCEVIGASMVGGAQVSVLRLLSWTIRHGTQTSFYEYISYCFYSFNVDVKDKLNMSYCKGHVFYVR